MSPALDSQTAQTSIHPPRPSDFLAQDVIREQLEISAFDKWKVFTGNLCQRLSATLDEQQIRDDACAGKQRRGKPKGSEQMMP